MTALASGARRDGAFVRARLGSLLAVVPLGIWTVAHLWDNLAAFRGADAWQEAVTGHAHPIAFFVSVVVALLPLALHTVWGIGRLVSSRPNNGRYLYFSNLKYLLQRISAVGVLLFLGAHVYKAMIVPRTTRHAPEAFADIAHEMHHHGPTLVVYVLGTLGVAYHLANGLHTFTMGWGIATSRTALKRLDKAALLVFLVLLAMSWAAIYALWEAGA